jgi:hypothetical protein
MHEVIRGVDSVQRFIEAVGIERICLTKRCILPAPAL